MFFHGRDCIGLREIASGSVVDLSNFKGKGFLYHNIASAFVFKYRNNCKQNI